MNQNAKKYNGADLLKAIFDDNRDFLNGVFQNMDEAKRAFTRCGLRKYSLLNYAVTYSSPEIVKHFLEMGLPPDGPKNSSHTRGQAPLHLAAIHCKYRVVKLLLDYGCRIDAKDQSSRTALHHAVENGISRELCTSSRAVICHLLRRGAAVNVKNSQGETPLLHAVKHGSETLVRLLLRYGASVSQRKGVNGDNALHCAARRSHKGIVEMLLNAGAEVNSVAKKGITALHLAASRAKSAEIVDLLIERGALVNAKDDSGKTPIFMPHDNDYAFDDDDDDDDDEDDEDDDDEEDYEEVDKRRCHIVRSLLNAGAEVNISNNMGEPAFHRAVSSGLEPIIELFLERGADIHAKNREGRSALHIAVKYASEKVVEMLIDRGAKVNDSSLIGATPLHLAVQFHRIEHIKVLLDRGADVNVVDLSGFTPLHYAARLSHVDEPTVEAIVDMLLLNDADPFDESMDGKNSLNYALEKSNPGMIKVLLCHLADLESIGEGRAAEAAMRAIGNEEKWLRVYENRQREIVVMKEEKIYENLSYFDVVTRDPEVLVRNQEFVKAFKSNQVIKAFDYYDMVMKVIDIAITKRDMTLTAVECLSVLFADFCVPIPIIEMTLKYFEFEDLKKFVESCQELEILDD